MSTSETYISGLPSGLSALSRSAGAKATDDAPHAPLFLSVRETARLLGMPASTVYDLVKQGRIPHLKLGGRIRIAESVIRGFLRTAGVSA